MEMHYRLNEFQNFLQNLALDAHDGLYQKSALAFIRHWSRVGGNDKLAIDKGGNLPEKVENHWSSPPPNNLMEITGLELSDMVRKTGPTYTSASDQLTVADPRGLGQEYFYQGRHRARADGGSTV